MTIPDELEVELERYLAAQDAEPSLAAVAQTALRRFLRSAEPFSQGHLASVLRKRRAIVEAARSHGAVTIRLFGSVATGNETAESDLDFVVETQSGTTLFDLARLRFELEQMLGVDVDVVSAAGLTDSMRREVFEESILL